jgi:hypothetical protein
MDVLLPRFSLPTTMFTESEPRSISQSIDYVRETEATGLPAPVECHKQKREHSSEASRTLLLAETICLCPLKGFGP